MGGNKTVYFTISYNLYYVSHHIKLQRRNWAIAKRYNGGDAVLAANFILRGILMLVHIKLSTSFISWVDTCSEEFKTT